MIINRIWNLTELIVIILTILTSILCEQQERQQSLDQLFHIVTSLRRFHSQKCQFKFENCIQDLSYANQLDTECNVYSHLRDCFRSLLDESQCLSHQLKHQYNEAKKHEYEACGSISSYESVRSSCFVHKFRLREKSADDNNNDQSTTSKRKEYDCLCIASRNLETRKSIIKIKVVRISFHRLFALSDNLIQILDSDSFQIIPNIKLKNVLTFTILNVSDPHQAVHVDICISTKRNKIQIYRLDKINMNIIYEISVQDSFISIAMDDCGILGCSETEYFSCNQTNSNDRRLMGSFRSIFRLDDPNIPTCFTDISPGQYLLNGPNVGVTTSLQGTSQRTPIMFISSPVNFIYSNPYLIVLVKDYIHIYSYLDDQLKQEIPLKHCRTLTIMQQENIKNVIVSNKDNIYLLEQLSLEEQIDQLLNSYRLQEALILAESNCSLIKQYSTNSLVISTKKRIGLIEFSAMNIIRALNIFNDIHLDFHEIITQIPNFLPLNSSWPNVDENMKSQYFQWLNGFCDYMIINSTEFSRQPDYYTSLLKAYLMIQSRETINEYVEINSLNIPVDYSNILIDAQLYHAVAILYSAHDEHQQAIDIWKKLVLKEYSNDDTFPGIWIIAKYILERNIDRKLEFSTALWLLEQNEEDLALKIFTNKHQTESNNDPFSSNRVIDSIKTYPTALTIYLEYVVFKLKLETDEIHTMLVNIYLDQILTKSNNETEQTTRSKLQAFIITSNSFRVQSVLNRINQTNRLQREVALLYGKMNNLEQAFRILIDELQDFDYAENYCLTLSQGKSSDDRKIIAHVLFKVFLNSLDKYPNEITAALLRLLCNNEIEFDFIDVLQRLPSHWSLASLSQILLRAIRTYSYTRRSSKIELALIRVQNERLNIKLAKLRCLNTIVDEHRRCKHCQQQFYETSCVIYEDGNQVHVHCAKKYDPNKE